MFVYDLTFCFQGDPQDYEFNLIDFLCLLSENNQIIYESLNISGTDNRRVARVSVPYIDSLEEKYYDTYTKAAYERLAAQLSEPVAIHYVGEDFSFGDDCSTGAKADDYVLCIHPNLRDLSPICCGHCRGHIPYYFLPKLSEKTVKELTSWEVSYAAYDRLFYATGIGEMSAHKMLSNISSRLNQQGLSVCRMLEAELQKPVYYYLYRFYGKQPRQCPICGGDWKAGEDDLYDYRCEVCRIVADKTPDQSE